MGETVLDRRRPPRMILSREGKIVDRPALHALGLTADAILTMYRHMLLTRLFCDAANASAHRGQMALFISSKGQEGAEVASASALATHDWIFWYLRTWGAALTRGITSATLFQWLYGVEEHQVATDFLAHHAMLPYILVGNHLPHTVGFAASKMMQGDDAVSIAYFGDGATSTRIPPLLRSSIAPPQRPPTCRAVTPSTACSAFCFPQKPMPSVGWSGQTPRTAHSTRS